MTRRMLTWAQFKDRVEHLDVRDDDKIRYIDLHPHDATLIDVRIVTIHENGVERREVTIT